ncbi:MAG: hypothetical protein HZY76_13180 [Anaerolineae bacterium]|nr:MAG: hypothetical protein HZY76_13180 [Anaerolineae bacterium]
MQSRLPVRSEIRLRPVNDAMTGDLSDLTLYQLKLMAYHLAGGRVRRAAGVGGHHLWGHDAVARSGEQRRGFDRQRDWS